MVLSISRETAISVDHARFTSLVGHALCRHHERSVILRVRRLTAHCPEEDDLHLQLITAVEYMKIIGLPHLSKQVR